MKIIEGGICAVRGVLAGGACEDEYGVAVIVLKIAMHQQFSLQINWLLLQ